MHFNNKAVFKTCACVWYKGQIIHVHKQTATPQTCTILFVFFASCLTYYADEPVPVVARTRTLRIYVDVQRRT